MRESQAPTPASCPYSTHLQVTVACAVRTGQLWPGSKILELGCGDYSTPVLASIAHAQDRPLTIVSSDPIWAARFEYLESSLIELKIIDSSNWPRFSFEETYGMVLVDNEQTVQQRMGLVRRLASRAKVVVLHDANAVERDSGSWHPTKRLFRHLYVHRRLRPYTAIMSNYVEPKLWFSGVELAEDTR